MKLNKLLIIIYIILSMLLLSNSVYAFSRDLSKSLRVNIGDYERLQKEMQEVVYVVKEINEQQVIISEMPKYLAEEKDLPHVTDKGSLNYADEVNDKLEFIDIIRVNKEGNEEVIGKTLRKKKVSDLAHEKGLMHRTANAFVLTPKGEVVIDRRAHNKAQPLRLSILGGHVPSGEGYGTTVRKEIPEELNFPQGWTLQGKVLTVGKMGAFEYNDSENNERRSLYVYVLSEEEYEMVKLGKAKMGEDKALTTEKQFRADLEEKQKPGKGGGEVWGRYIFDMEKILKPEKDIRGPFIELVDKFQDSSNKDNVYFTEDLLRPLLEDIEVVEAIKFIARVIKEGKDTIEDYPQLLSIRDLEALRDAMNGL